MKKLMGHLRTLPWLTALLLSGLVTACGGGGGGNSSTPVVGSPTAPAPSVTAVAPMPNAVGVSVNTKVITAAFSQAMDPATLTSASFNLACPTGIPVAGSVNYLAFSNLTTLTLTLPADSVLPPNTLCTGTVTTAVKDTLGAALASNFVWTFMTGVIPNNTPPQITATINANGANGVAINTKVGATFSAAMDPTTLNAATFTLKQGTTLIVGVVSYSGVNAVFVPASILTNNTTYTATITTGAKDLTGNALTSDYQWSWTTGSAADTTSPQVTATINANGATNVAINTKVGATFSKAMDPLRITNVNFSVREFVSGNAVAGLVSYSGVSALFIPLAPLVSSTRYTVTVKGGARGVADLAGNVMVNDYVVSWTTGVAPDTTAPHVIGTIHTNGDTNVAVNAKVGATFSESMDHLTITNLNFGLKESVSGKAVAGSVSYSGVNAVFMPLTNLASSTGYTVTVKGGIGGAADLAGNVMVRDYVLSWTTAALADITAPTVMLLNPADLAANVAVSSAVNVTFSEAMDPLTINTASLTVAGVAGTVTFNAANRIATFTPSSMLASSTTYTATLTNAARDLAGNALTANKVWSFTTTAMPVVLPPPGDLGTASTFGALGASGMSNSGTQTLINGDIGTTATATSSISGFHDTTGYIFSESPANTGAVNGSIYTCTNATALGIGPFLTTSQLCAIASQARLDAQAAYLALVAMPPGANPGANLANLTLAPGVYTSPSGSFLVQGGDLTLDAQGDANAVWVFQVATTLTVGGPGTAAPQSIILARGAQAKNVYWQVGGLAIINAAGGGTMVGTLISQAGASFSSVGNLALVTLEGRILSPGASITLVNTVVNVPAP